MHDDDDSECNKKGSDFLEIIIINNPTDIFCANLFLIFFLHTKKNHHLLKSINSAAFNVRLCTI